MTEAGPLGLEGVSHRYPRVTALEDLTLKVPGGCLAGIIGPDGVGKSTLLGLIAGAKRVQEGRIEVLGGELADAALRRRIAPRIAYMPQGLGGSLYPELSVRENLDFFGRLFGHARPERERRIAELLAATGLAPFFDRPVGKLSGGMKQKLGLCCALIHDPELLVLDEPTTGVDPLSRRQFWDLIGAIRARRPAMSVVVSTAYMEEAARFDWRAAMDRGRVLASGAPAELTERTGTSRLEAAYRALRPGSERPPLEIPPRDGADGEPIISASGLTRRFGDFTAVDGASFEIHEGEIFGFLASNGCGKTTTMKMLTGLLPVTAGEARLLGRPVDARDAFWELLVDLSRGQGVTIFLSTHFMTEAERCDRVSLMHAGKVLACDTPARLVEDAGTRTLEEAFVARLRGAEAGEPPPDETGIATAAPARDDPSHAVTLFSPPRLAAFARRETLKVLRDPFRVAFAFFGSAILMVVFCHGISLDIEDLDFAVLDLDRTPESRDYVAAYEGSRYFRAEPPLASERDAWRSLSEGDVSFTLEIPPGFGRDLTTGTETAVLAIVDGAIPFKGETVEGYVAGIHAGWLAKRTAGGPLVEIEPRFRYNPSFESINAMAPSMPAILLIMLPAILTAVAVARERELGSIVNFYVTPTTRLEFLAGKQAPYVVIAFANFVLLAARTCSSSACLSRAAPPRSPSAPSSTSGRRLPSASSSACRRASRPTCAPAARPSSRF